MINKIEVLLSGQQFRKLVEELFKEVNQKYNLHKAETDIILFLSQRPNCTARDISKERCYSKAHVSKAIEHLVMLGYVTCKTDSKDRRKTHLYLTTKTQPIIEEILNIREKLLCTLFHGITKEEKAVMLQIATKISNNINAILCEKP